MAAEKDDESRVADKEEGNGGGAEGASPPRPVSASLPPALRLPGNLSSSSAQRRRFMGMSSFGGGGGSSVGSSSGAMSSIRVSKMFSSRRRSDDTNSSKHGPPPPPPPPVVKEGADSDDDEDDVDAADARRIRRAARDAGKYADGIDAVEIWVLDPNTKRLVRPDGGWWRSPDFLGPDASEDAKEALERIEDEDRPDFVGAEPLLPGTGLAGKLWAEASAASHGGGGGGGLMHLMGPRGGGGLDDAIEEEEEEGDEDEEEEAAGGKKAGKGGTRNLFAGMEDDSDEEGDEDGFIDNAYGAKSKKTTVSPAKKDTDIESSIDNDKLRSASPSDRRRSSASSMRRGSVRASFTGNNRRRSSSTASLQRDASSRRGLNRTRSSMAEAMKARPDFRRSMMMESKRMNKSSRRVLSTRHILPFGIHQHQPALTWRNLVSLSSDPDQPTFQRLALIEEAGFGQAAGVPFEVGGRGGGGEGSAVCKGVVIYLSKLEVDKKRLNAPANEAYLLRAADAAGAAAALSSPRKKSLEAREERRKRMEGAIPFDPEKDDKAKGGGNKWDELEASGSCLGGGAKRVRAWASKCKGGDLQPPPPAPTSQALLTFFGACSTMLILGAVSEGMSDASDGRHRLILPPFGALMMLQYGLVMAPASQPRNAIMGQIVSLTVALCFSYIPSEDQGGTVPKYVSVALATSFAVALMARLGVVHPPAAAAAAVVSGMKKTDWVTIPLFVMGNLLAIGMATFVNNVSDKRQYPTYWGVSGWAERISNFCRVKPIEPYRPKAWDDWEDDLEDSVGVGGGGSNEEEEEGEEGDKNNEGTASPGHTEEGSEEDRRDCVV